MLFDIISHNTHSLLTYLTVLIDNFYRALAFNREFLLDQPFQFAALALRKHVGNIIIVDKILFPVLEVLGKKTEYRRYENEYAGNS